jgi:hypothetical protein
MKGYREKISSIDFTLGFNRGKVERPLERSAAKT